MYTSGKCNSILIFVTLKNMLLQKHANLKNIDILGRGIYDIVNTITG